MAGQKRWLRRVVVLPCHPSGLIPFPFGFSACTPCLNGFLFFCFFLLETISREKRTPTSLSLSEQRFVFLVINFLNQLPELLKMVFDNIIQIRINRELVDAHNVCKPVEHFVVFLPYIDRFAPACNPVWNFKELYAIVLFRQLLCFGGAFFRVVC